MIDTTESRRVTKHGGGGDGSEGWGWKEEEGREIVSQKLHASQTMG